MGCHALSREHIWVQSLLALNFHLHNAFINVNVSEKPKNSLKNKKHQPDFGFLVLKKVKSMRGSEIGYGPAK